MVMPVPIHWTAQMVRDLPDDGNRYETVHGVLLVTPAPRTPHQLALGRLFLRIGHFLEAHPFGVPFFSPADISWSDDTLVQPDMFVVSPEEARGGWTTMRTLLLAVEVVSPSSRRADRVIKRTLYQQHGVRHYWVVDPKAQQIEAWTPESREPVIHRDTITWKPLADQPGCTIAIPPLFAPI